MARPSEIWPKNARIIEIGMTSADVGRRLVAVGYKNYLAVTATCWRSEQIATRHPELQSHVTPALPLNDVRQNNAEVLVLQGWAALNAGRLRSIRHAQWVAIKLQPTPLCWLGILLAVLQCLLYRFRWPRVVNCSAHGVGPLLLAFRVRKPRPYNGVRRFIPHRVGIAGFLHELTESNTQHAVLRWFENLPQLPAGEDVDLLVDDASLEAVRTALDDGPGIQPIDVYSVTGLPGADYRSMPYYPPHLAEELLARAVTQRGMCSVPAPREHFLSLAYHAIYHKGFDSGIPENEQSSPRSAKAGHDYVAVLTRLAAAARIEVPVTLESLDDYLDAEGWRPPHDMLIRLARRNRWLRTRLRKLDERETADDRVAVFLLREVALNRGGVARAEQLIRQNGFEIRAIREFDGPSKARLARTLRGGNWARGPWPISGGPPVAAIVAYDPAPITPTRKQKKRFPFIANARLLCKEQLRNAFNDGMPSDQQCNVIHSSDNGREALDYLRLIMPEMVATVLSGTSAIAVKAA